MCSAQSGLACLIGLAYDETGRLLASATKRGVYLWDLRAAGFDDAIPIMHCESQARVSSISFVAGLPVLVVCAEDFTA